MTQSTSVKQLADKMAVSKPTVVRYLDELGLRDGHTTVQGGRGTLMLDEYAASAIAHAIATAPDQKAAKQETKRQERQGAGTISDEVWRNALDAYKSAAEAAEERYDGLMSQLEAKDAQIAAKDAQIASQADQIERLTAQLETANNRANALSQRSWLDRLLHRGLPAGEGR